MPIRRWVGCTVFNGYDFIGNPLHLEDEVLETLARYKHFSAFAPGGQLGL